ncbi:MAG: hypothetical protein WC526_04600 [Patescibacteria group bacterium]
MAKKVINGQVIDDLGIDLDSLPLPAQLLEERRRKGHPIEIPSLGVIIMPDGTVVDKGLPPDDYARASPSEKTATLKRYEPEQGFFARLWRRIFHK